MDSGTRSDDGAEERVDGPTLPENTGYLLAMAGAMCRQHWVGELSQLDISPSQYKVLLCLAEVDSLGQRQLAERVGMDPRNCVPVVDSLVQAGLLIRDGDASDRRRRVLSLTGRGKRLAKDLTAVGDQIAADVLIPLDRAEQAVLRGMLVAVLSHALD